jgi:hypothetical protein
MVSVGVPKPNVYGKMAADGVTADDVDRFKIANGDAPAAAPPASARQPAVDKEALKQDPKFTK